MALSVEAGAIVVAVKGKERYLYKGAILPDGVKADDIKRLKSIGLVKDVKVATRPRAAAAKEDAGSATDQSDAEVAATKDDEGSVNAALESEDEGAADPESEDMADEKTKSRSRTKK